MKNRAAGTFFKMVFVASLAFFAVGFTSGIRDAPEAYAGIRSNTHTNDAPVLPNTDAHDASKANPSIPYFSDLERTSKRKCFALVHCPDGSITCQEYPVQTLTEEDAGASVNGSMAESAVLHVTRSADVLHESAECEACKKMRDEAEANGSTSPCVIEIEGAHASVMDATFEVGEDLDGRSAFIYHCIDGSLEKTSSKVENGAVTTPFEVGKPFVVVIPEDDLGEAPSDAAQENEPPIAVIMAITAIACGLGYTLHKAARRRRTTDQE